MTEPLKKGDQVLVSTEVDPQLSLLGDILLRMLVVVVSGKTAFTCALPADSQNEWLHGKRIALTFADEGKTWVRGWDRNSRQAFRAMLMLKTA